jgi:hypothetical protein
MSENKKQQLRKKNLILGLILMFVSTNRAFRYLVIQPSDFTFGLFLLVIGLIILITIILKRKFEKRKNEQEEKPKVYVYSKSELNSQKEEKKNG